MQNAEMCHQYDTEAVGSDSIAFSANIDVLDDAVARGTDIENPELTSLARGLEKKSTLGSSPVRSIAASRIFRLLTSLLKPFHPSKFGRIKSLAAQALIKGLKFIGKSDGGAGWDAVEKRFDELATANGLLPRSRFGECIGMTEKSNPRGVKMNEESKDFAGELFDALARRRNITGGLINKAQLKQLWDQISDQNFDSRLQTFFDMVDKNEDGRITVEEVRVIISLSASANKLSNIKEQADEYAAFIMKELDPDNLGRIMIETLEMYLLQASNQSVGVGESKNLRPMLRQKLMPTQEPNPRPRRWYQDFKYFLLDNWQRIWVMALWIGVMAGLFAYKYVQYKKKAAYEVMGHCVCMAKGAAETLKLNMALILLPVCRNTITWLRNKTRLGVAVPFNDNFDFHKIIAFAVAIGVGIHAISHLACDFPRLLHASREKYEPMKPFFGEQPTSYWHFVKGVEGVTGIIMVVLMSIAFTLAMRRRSKVKVPKILNKVDFISVMLNKVTGFNAFWYSHHIFVIVYALLIVHGIKLYLAHDWYKKTTWMYIAIPVTLYAGERLIRSSRSRIEPVKILKVGLYPGDVLALHLSKPQGFKYKSGQYIFVKCVSVSPIEWHPFSITSAPGDDDISVHIRSNGDWTRQIRKVFSEVFQLPLSGKSGLLTVDYLKEENNPSFPRVLIDGPYGALAQDYKNFEVVVLVGLGIGATPMISILKDIVNNMQLAKYEEKNALADVSESKFKTRKAYFYWVTKDQGSFEWFKGIMNEVAEMDQEEVIEMHNHCTSVYEEGDARSAFITMLQSLYYAKNGVDIVSGTRVKCHFARPDWRKVYQHIATNNTDTTVGVFLCGSQGKDLRQLALEFSHKTSTKFDFHKENF